MPANGHRNHPTLDHEPANLIGRWCIMASPTDRTTSDGAPVAPDDPAATRLQRAIHGALILSVVSLFFALTGPLW